MRGLRGRYGTQARARGNTIVIYQFTCTVRDSRVLRILSPYIYTPLTGAEGKPYTENLRGAEGDPEPGLEGEVTATRGEAWSMDTAVTTAGDDSRTVRRPLEPAMGQQLPSDESTCKGVRVCV